MSTQETPLERLEALLGKLHDLHNSAVAVVEKMGTIQMDALDAKLEALATSLDEAFSSASKAATAVEKVLHDTEIEKNRLESED